MIDENSGMELSAHIGRISREAEAMNKRRMPAGSINVIPTDEIARGQQFTRVQKTADMIGTKGGGVRAQRRSAGSAPMSEKPHENLVLSAIVPGI